MPSVTFSGLSSGIDSASLISQLVAAEKQPATLLQRQQSDLASQKSIVDSLSTQVAALGTLVGGMTLASDVQYRTATATDSHVSVAVSGDASAATHSIRVLTTAAAQVTSSQTFASDTAGVAGVGTLTITTAGKTPATVSWDATDSLTSIASKINNAGAGANASVLFDGTAYRLIVTAAATGTANVPAFADTGSGLGLSDPANVKVPAGDATVMIDGIKVTRPSNVIDDALAGVTLTAVSPQAASDANTTVSVSLDTGAVVKQLGSVVSAYNAIVGAIDNQLTYKGTTAGTDTLFGDSTLRQLKASLSQIVTQKFGSLTMADLGMTLDKTGVLSLDSSKLDSALASNQNALADLFVTGGLSQTFANLARNYTEAGDGILATKSKGLTDRSQELQKQIDEITSNADALQTRLQAQFTALEQTMSALNSQSTYISKILTG